MKDKKVVTEEEIIREIKRCQDVRKYCTEIGGDSIFQRIEYNDKIDYLFAILEDLQRGTHKQKVIDLKKRLEMLRHKNKEIKSVKKKLNELKIKKLSEEIKFIEQKNKEIIESQDGNDYSYIALMEEDKKIRIQEIEERLPRNDEMRKKILRAYQITSISVERNALLTELSELKRYQEYGTPKKYWKIFSELFYYIKLKIFLFCLKYLYWYFYLNYDMIFLRGK